MHEPVSSAELEALGVEATVAERVATHAATLCAALPPEWAWRELTRPSFGSLGWGFEPRLPTLPFAAQKLVFERLYRDWDPAEGPPPAWSPRGEERMRSNLGRLMHHRGVRRYENLHVWSTGDREGFWSEMTVRLGIRFRRDPERILDLSDGPTRPRWMAGARINIQESCFQARKQSTAILSCDETGAVDRWSYRRLYRYAERAAGALLGLGLQPGDAVAFCTAITPEACGIYLGVVRAGLRAIGISSSFAPDEIRKRLRIGEAKIIVAQDVQRRGGEMLQLYAKIIDAKAPPALLLPGSADPPTLRRDEDRRWNDVYETAAPAEAVPCDPDDVTNVLFSSGTTGDPKAIPWTHLTPIKAAADGHLHHDIQPGDVVCWPTSLGWMMGPWLIYASLINRATIALFQGAPTGRAFCEFVRDAGVTMLGVVPSLVRGWRAQGATAGIDWSQIRCFSSTGECSNADDMLWLMAQAGYRPVIEYCTGTEIGGGYATGTLVQSAAPATFSTPALGLDLTLRDEAGQTTQSGEVFLVGPSIGLSNRLLNGDHDEVYYAGTPEGPDGAPLRRHGDHLERLGRGFLRAHGRIDDTMNLGGIKVSSVAIERVVGEVSGVEETAAIAVPSAGGGPSVLLVYAVAQAGAEVSAEGLRAAMQTAIRAHLNPLFEVSEVRLVDRLPRTASNKIMRRVLRAEHAGPGDDDDDDDDDD